MLFLTANHYSLIDTMTDTSVSSIASSWLSQPAITFSGLGSGIDSQSIITKLVEAEGRQLEKFTAWKTEWTAKIQALQTLNSKLAAFRAAVAAMDTPAEFQARTATVSPGGVLTASAVAGASLGSHQVLVQQLARYEIEVHGGASAADTVVNASGTGQTFAFTYGTTSVSVSVPDGATLSDLATAINQSGANPGVVALVLDMGPAYAGDRYRLMLKGQDTGAAYGIAVDDALTTLDGTAGTLDFTSSTFTETQAAANAQVRLDGYPPGAWIERDDNLISDIIPGVSLSLKAASDTAVTVSVAADTAAMQEQIASLVEHYNEVIAYIQEITRFDPVTKEAGLLLGNYVVQMVKSGLKGITTGNVPGFVNPPDRYLNLAQLGITTDVDQASATFGQLLIDEAALGAALNGDPEAVGELLAVSFKGVSDDASGTLTYYSALPGITRPGIYEISATVAGGVLTGGTINGHPAVVSGDTLTGTDGFPEYGLAVRVGLTDGTHTARVRLKSGLNGSLTEKLDELLSLSSGPVNILMDNYQDIIAGIDAKIEWETRRLEAYRQRLADQFSRLEAVLSQLNEQSNYLAGQIQKLQGTNSSA